MLADAMVAINQSSDSVSDWCALFGVQLRTGHAPRYLRSHPPTLIMDHMKVSTCGFLILGFDHISQLGGSSTTEVIRTAASSRGGIDRSGGKSSVAIALR